jgi:mannose/fructose-specific phosphotransferase system component IIA
MSSMNEMTRSNLVSSLVTQSQSSEIIAGFGLPSVTKTIPIKIGKSVSQLPFKGIAAHRSMSQEIATCTYNVGLVTGQLL